MQNNVIIMIAIIILVGAWPAIGHAETFSVSASITFVEPIAVYPRDGLLTLVRSFAALSLHKHVYAFKEGEVSIKEHMWTVE